MDNYMDNYMVIYENLPSQIKGFTLHHNLDDFYTIVINSKISYHQAKETFSHELKHILNKDFYKKDIDINEIENFAHA